MDGEGERVPKKMEEASDQADWRWFPEGSMYIYIYIACTVTHDTNPFSLPC